MASNPLRSVLAVWGRSAGLHDGDERTNSQLLEAFLRSRDSLALETLVRRHAPMVWGVCRRTLANDHEAEDAFQATFLVLVRRAASLHTPELFSHWLYRVAYTTARKARQTAAKRGSREKQVKVLPEPPPEPPRDTFGLDLREVLDAELRRLPEKYQSAIVLCDLEEKTRHEAARQLGLPEGTVASRLAKGRSLLARRLLRRGLGVSATGLAAGLQQAASAAVPAASLANTVKAISLLAAGDATAARLVSAEVSPLADSVLRAMTVAKQKTVGLWLVLATLVLAGGMVAYDALAARRAPEVAGEVRRLPASAAPGEVRRIPVEEWAWSVSFSPKGRQFLIGTGGGGSPIRICDVFRGKEAPRTIPYGGCWSVVYSPNGKSIAVGSGSRPIEILDAVTGQAVWRPRQGYRGRVRNVTFSPDGRLIAASHEDGQLRLWDVAQGQVLRTFPAYNSAVHSAVFTPDGKHLLVIDRGASLRLYEVDSGREVHRFEGHTARITDVGISADGRHGLSCSADKTLRLWDLQTGKELRRLVGPDEGLHGVAFCPDGWRALSGGEKTVRLWDLRTGQQLYRFDGHQGAVCCVAVSPNGRYALSGSSDHTVRLWRLPGPAEK